MRSCLDVLGVIFNGLVKLLQMNAYFHQTVENGSAHRRALIRHQQQCLAVLIPVFRLIYLADHTERADIPDPFPVNGIRCFRRHLIILLVNVLFYFLQLEVIFVFVQYSSPHKNLYIRTCYQAILFSLLV